MAKNVAPVPVPNRRAARGGVAERGAKVRPRRGEFRNNDAGIPGVIGHKRSDVQVRVIRTPVVDQLDSCANTADMRLDRRNTMWRFAHSNIGLDADCDLEFEAQATKVLETHRCPGSMNALRQNDASNRMVDPAKSLHRS